MRSKNLGLGFTFLLVSLLLVACENNVGKDTSIEETSPSSSKGEQIEQLESQEENQEVNLEESVNEKEKEEAQYPAAPKELSGEELQEKAYEVQAYIVNLVNDLTVIDHMSSELKSVVVDASIYPEDIIGGKEAIIEDINDKANFLIEASDDLNKLTPPQNTDYLIFDPGLKEFANQYKELAINIKKTANEKDDGFTTYGVSELNSLDSEVQELQISLGVSIGENYYSEYGALLQVWNEMDRYANRDNMGLIAPGISIGLYQSGRNFKYEINR